MEWEVLEILSSFVWFPQEIQETSHTLKEAFLIFPGYALGRGLMDIVITKTVNEVNAMLPGMGRLSS